MNSYFISSNEKFDSLVYVIDGDSNKVISKFETKAYPLGIGLQGIPPSPQSGDYKSTAVLVFVQSPVGFIGTELINTESNTGFYGKAFVPISEGAISRNYC